MTRSALCFRAYDALAKCLAISNAGLALVHHAVLICKSRLRTDRVREPHEFPNSLLAATKIPALRNLFPVSWIRELVQK